jgi:hypothetical protein
MITTEYVLKGILVEKVIDVMASTLRNVINDQVRAFPDLTTLVGSHAN